MFTAGATRWVVDFKASTIEGTGIDRFLAQQMARYREQLARYAAAVADTPGPAVRTALYFPQLGRMTR